MSYETIVFSVEDGVATIALNRPDALNALVPQMAEELADAMGRTHTDAAVRAVVVKGMGRVFSAGGDVKAFAEYLRADPQVALLELAGHLHAGIVGIRRTPKPVIAQVHGVAAGAGMSLALACDLTIAADTARFMMAYARVGLSPDGSSTYFLPRLVGFKKALEIFYIGDPIPADEALRLGMVNRVVAEAALEEETQALAHRLAAGPTLAFGRAKELTYRSLHQGLEVQLENERQYIARCGLTADFREGVQALLEKRDPKFSGR
jgi:2-(1,2-epoxy-1,2-dihydrophenyl)acetyl-CoA isomerase